ncbi:XRE family transcriptional regulator [Streptomyces sp. NPDC001339]|uniref:XRE family transcriptional regulator n=1 Tax=Streptomyces sp. NPDC001339 TaxID=3364563 RepID=UPI0036848CCD
MGDQPPAEGRTMAQKLGYLIETLHPKDRGPYSYQEIAELIRQRAADGGPTVSHGTIHNIAIGKVTNPSVDSLRALGDFFGVGARYFLDDEATAAVDARIREIQKGAERARAGNELADALEDKDVRAVAFRLRGLSANALRGIKSIVDGARQAEGLPEVEIRRSRRHGQPQ